jgi:flagellar basal-body rod modification protein FlgD
MQVTETNGSELRDEFLQLLVTQLRNQDPLDPVGQQEFTAQLAQFSVLEELESLNASFEEILVAQKESMATQSLAQNASIVDRIVSFQASEDEQPRTGRVDSVSVDDKNVYAQIGSEQILISEIRAILSESALLQNFKER